MKPISNKTIRGIVAGGLAMLGCLAVHAEDAADANSFVHNDVKYTIEEQWLNPTVLSDLYATHKNGFANGEQLFQFFVKDGIIYFCSERGLDNNADKNTKLLALDSTDGQEIGLKTVAWNGLKGSDYAAVYCGTDSYHNAYLASFGANISGFTSEFELYVLDTTGDAPSVSEKYNLPLGTDMWVQRVDVTGNLSTGNFTVTASIWEDMYLATSSKTYIGVWACADGKVGAPRIVPENITVAKASTVGENLLLVQDGASLAKATAPVRAKNPTLLDISGDEAVEKSTLAQEEGDDDFGNSFAMLDVDGDHFMLYAHKGNPVAFKMVYLPNFPENFDGAKTVWTYEPGEAFSKGLTSNKEREMTNIFVEKPDEDGTNIYLSANGMGMAKLTMTKDEITTGVENLVVEPADAAAEYFDITGRRLGDKPAAGFYIERRGTEATKHIAR